MDVSPNWFLRNRPSISFNGEKIVGQKTGERRIPLLRLTGQTNKSKSVSESKRYKTKSNELLLILSEARP
jgi:hypothetical protein